MRKIAVISVTIVLAVLVMAVVSCSAATTTSTTVTPGVAVKLVFVTQPGGSTPESVFTRLPVLKAVDANGNTVTSYKVPVILTITPGAGASGARLFGATTVSPVNGAAVFTDLSINLVGSGYTLTATSGSLASAISGPFDITPSQAAKLTFSQQPAGVTAGFAFTKQPVIAVEDANGNTVSDSTASVTLTITSGTGANGAILSGTTTVNAVDGVAAFDGLSINLAGSGYTLTATSSGLASATSDAFDVIPNEAVKLVFGSQVSDATAGSAFTPSPVVWIEDIHGHIVTGSMAAVTLIIEPGTGKGGVLSGTTTVSAVNGVALFKDVSIERNGTGYKLTAMATGLTSATSNSFDITAGKAVKLGFLFPLANAKAGSVLPLHPVVWTEDVYGNLAQESAPPVTIAITPGTGTKGAVLSGTMTVDAVNVTENGVAVFDDLSINLAGSGYTLTATSGDLTPAISNAFDVEASSP